MSQVFEYFKFSLNLQHLNSFPFFYLHLILGEVRVENVFYQADIAHCSNYLANVIL